METPAEVRLFLYNAWKGSQMILEGVKADAPKYAETLERNYSSPITYYTEPELSGVGGYAMYDRREIHLRTANGLSLVHEIAHLLVPSLSVGEEWKDEAIAQYLSSKYFYTSADKKLDYDSYFTDTDALKALSDIEGYFEIGLKAREIYAAYAGYPQTADEIDGILFSKAWLTAYYLVSSEVELEPVTKAYQNMGGWIKPGGGNELSYDEVLIFADYLIETYSLTTFLDYCFDADATFEETFGIDYETAKTAWLDELLSKYCNT